MKKLILSAVMMMAFVGTSMAKTGEVEVVNKVADGLESTEVSSKLAGPCSNQFGKDLSALLAAGISFNSACAIAYVDFYDCLECNY